MKLILNLKRSQEQQIVPLMFRNGNIANTTKVIYADRVLSMGKIELNCILMLILIVWNRTDYLHKMDLALNNLQWLICHKSQTTKPSLKKKNIKSFQKIVSATDKT